MLAPPHACLLRASLLRVAPPPLVQSSSSPLPCSTSATTTPASRPSSASRLTAREAGLAGILHSTLAPTASRPRSLVSSQRRAPAQEEQLRPPPPPRPPSSPRLTQARAAARGVARGAARLPAKGARGVSQGMSRAASSAGPAAFRAGAGGGSRNGETHHSQGAPQQPRGRDRRADPSERSAHFLNTEGDRGGPSRRDSVTSGCVECSQGASSRPPPEPERPPSLLERARKLFDNLYYHDGGVPGGLPSG